MQVWNLLHTARWKHRTHTTSRQFLDCGDRSWICNAPLVNLNLNLMRQRIQVIQLTITGKKAIAYIYPLLSLRWRSNFHLKPANEHPEIISSSKIFHSFTTLLLKDNLATSNLTLFLFNFNEWPQRLDCDISKTFLDQYFHILWEF